MKSIVPKRLAESGEFLWLVSLSDLMMLLFIFFVVMFSYSYKKIKKNDFRQLVAEIRHEQVPKTPVDQLKQNLTNWVNEQKLQDQISVNKVDDTLRVEIKDKVLFSSGEFMPNKSGTEILKLLAKTLESIPSPYQLGIEGHTDDSPVHTDAIEDNWDLSAKRALWVMYSLNLSAALSKRTVLMAHGDNDPIVPNRDDKGDPLPENQSKNRRVTLRIF